MKKLLVLLGVLLLSASLVSAQTPSKPFTIYVNGGITTVNGPDLFKDFHKLGYNFGTGVGFKVAPMFQVVAKGGYHSISKDWELLLGVDGGKVKLLTFGADLRFAPSAPVMPIKPFGYVGLGFANISEADITLPLNVTYPGMEDQTKMYMNLGAGLEFSMTPIVKFFVEGQYMTVKTDGDNLSLIPISVGVKF